MYEEWSPGLCYFQATTGVPVLCFLQDFYQLIQFCQPHVHITITNVPVYHFEHETELVGKIIVGRIVLHGGNIYKISLPEKNGG
jgi:hypothetical protein